jgi:hypothetical protein
LFYARAALRRAFEEIGASDDQGRRAYAA